MFRANSEESQRSEEPSGHNQTLKAQKLKLHDMMYPQINCYSPALAGYQSFTFYILSRGNNAGQPNLSPWVNSFAVQCKSREELDFYFWLSYSLWQSGRFRPYIHGSVIPCLSVADVRRVLSQVATTLLPHWKSLQVLIEGLNKLKTAREHLAQQIIANDKLQQMLLRIHF